MSCFGTSSGKVRSRMWDIISWPSYASTLNVGIVGCPITSTKTATWRISLESELTNEELSTPGNSGSQFLVEILKQISTVSWLLDFPFWIWTLMSSIGLKQQW